MKKILLALAAISCIATSVQADKLYTSVTPVENSVLLDGSSASLSFEFTFDALPSVTTTSPSVTFVGADGKTVEPDDGYKAYVNSYFNSVTIFGQDYDGYTYTFTPTNQTYTLNIPAGLFKNAAGATNEAFSLNYYGTEIPTGVEGVKAASNAAVVARYNLQGQRVARGTRGVTIVKMSDGSTIKVMAR